MSEIHTEITNKAIGGSETMAKIEDNTFMENVKKVLIKISFPKKLKFAENLQILFSGYYYREESKIGGGHNT